MTLKEKFENVALVYDKALNLVKNNVQIADEFAIGFAEWTWNKELMTINDCGYFEYKFNLYTRKELLEIYKKEKGL